MDENQLSYEEIDREIEERSAARRKKLPHDVFDVVEFLVIAFAVILLLGTFFFRQTIVSGTSMQNTLQSGDRLIVSNFFYTPKTGDVVVVQLEDDITERFPRSLFEGQSIVKRVIATEGQRIALVNGAVYVDGEQLDEDSYRFLTGIDDYANMPEFTVPEGHIFLLGDHRDASLDSRAFLEAGAVVDERTVLGKVLFRVYPFSSFGGID